MVNAGEHRFWFDLKAMSRIMASRTIIVTTRIMTMANFSLRADTFFSLWACRDSYLENSWCQLAPERLVQIEQLWVTFGHWLPNGIFLQKQMFSAIFRKCNTDELLRGNTFSFLTETWKSINLRKNVVKAVGMTRRNVWDFTGCLDNEKQTFSFEFLLFFHRMRVPRVLLLLHVLIVLTTIEKLWVFYAPNKFSFLSYNFVFRWRKNSRRWNTRIWSCNILAIFSRCVWLS